MRVSNGDVGSCVILCRDTSLTNGNNLHVEHNTLRRDDGEIVVDLDTQFFGQSRTQDYSIGYRLHPKHVAIDEVLSNAEELVLTQDIYPGKCGRLLSSTKSHNTL